MGISPTSVPQGTKTLVSGTGSVDTTVADGSYNVNVKALGVSMKTCKADLCSASKCSLPAFTGSVDFRGLNCPQAAGDVTLGFDVTVSRTVPSSLAVLSIEITSEGSAGKLICATIQTSPGLGFEQRKTWDSYKQDFQKVYNSDDEDAAHQSLHLRLRWWSYSKLQVKARSPNFDAELIPTPTRRGCECRSRTPRRMHHGKPSRVRWPV